MQQSSASVQFGVGCLGLPWHIHGAGKQGLVGVHFVLVGMAGRVVCVGGVLGRCLALAYEVFGP